MCTTEPTQGEGHCDEDSSPQASGEPSIPSRYLERVKEDPIGNFSSASEEYLKSVLEKIMGGSEGGRIYVFNYSADEDTYSACAGVLSSEYDQDPTQWFGLIEAKEIMHITEGFDTVGYSVFDSSADNSELTRWEEMYTEGMLANRVVITFPIMQGRIYHGLISFSFPSTSFSGHDGDWDAVAKQYAPVLLEAGGNVYYAFQLHREATIMAELLEMSSQVEEARILLENTASPLTVILGELHIAIQSLSEDNDSNDPGRSDLLNSLEKVLKAAEKVVQINNRVTWTLRQHG